MDIHRAVRQIEEELEELFARADLGAADRLLDGLVAARRVYVAGEGRSGLVGRAFAMRLIHLGMHSFVCGETITPAIEAGDLCIACSGSGETPITCHRARRSREVGATVAAITAAPGSRLAAEADIEVVLPAPTTPSSASPSEQFGASLFEQSLLLFLDAMVLLLQEHRGASPESMSAKHANLE
ncbi:MAG: 6-phospho-3-hexuloisomerase [Candidatus Brocadiia bacterium]